MTRPIWFTTDDRNRLIRIENKLDQVLAKENEMITDMASAVAAIQAETSILNAIKTAEDALRGSAATIADEFAALKAQIAANAPPDFTALSAALDANSAAIGAVSAALQTAATP